MTQIRFHFFFFNDTATTEIYTLSLHDALPIFSVASNAGNSPATISLSGSGVAQTTSSGDRKSTRLNSSHGYISYAVFCLKKKKIGDLSASDPYTIAFESAVSVCILLSTRHIVA